jgi:hypothetical protein
MKISNTDEHFGGEEFRRIVPCTGTQVRLAEAMGVIKPAKSASSGWRLFARADIETMRAWIKTQPKRGPGRPARKQQQHD